MRAKEAGIPSKVIRPKDFPDKDLYGAALARELKECGTGLVVLAGFLLCFLPFLSMSLPGR